MSSALRFFLDREQIVWYMALSRAFPLWITHASGDNSSPVGADWEYVQNHWSSLTAAQQELVTRIIAFVRPVGRCSGAGRFFLGELTPGKASRHVLGSAVEFRAARYAARGEIWGVVRPIKNP